MSEFENTSTDFDISYIFLSRGVLEYESDGYVPTGERTGGGPFCVGFRRKRRLIGYGIFRIGPFFGVNFPKWRVKTQSV